ncbi:MAG: DUF2156 domain-containing protein [Acidobacteriota bacterium]
MSATPRHPLLYTERVSESVDPDQERRAETDQTRRRVLELLKRHGYNATSFQILEPDFCYWLEEDACVAYVDTGPAWVVAGGPISAPDLIGPVTLRFVQAARERRKRVCFFAVEKRFLDAVPFKCFPIGDQPWWDVHQWTDRLGEHRSLREQLRRARAKGVKVDSITAPEVADEGSPVRLEISELIGRWLKSRRMPAMAFLVELVPFSFPQERKYFVARANGRLVGFLVAIPVYGRGGWFLEDLLRDPEAPNGTAEAMVDAAFREIAASGSSFATLGLAPLGGDVRALRILTRLTSGFYNFAGVRRFKAKLRPSGWDPIFVAYPDGRTAIAALWDALSAFAHGHPFRFAVAAIFRAPAVVIGVMAGLLVPWTLLLALPDPTGWFPSAAVQLAWVVFDIFLAAALLGLTVRWRQWLGILLAAAISIDAMLTLFEGIIFNVRHASGPTTWAVVIISILAPLGASTILWGGVLTRRVQSLRKA